MFLIFVVFTLGVPTEHQNAARSRSDYYRRRQPSLASRTGWRLPVTICHRFIILGISALVFTHPAMTAITRWASGGLADHSGVPVAERLRNFGALPLHRCGLLPSETRADSYSFDLWFSGGGGALYRPRWWVQVN
ncbi:hypothetical protein [Klebsiella pneumoniae]|uniref:hypothetical protein n=1 Tax=Klebsiella pneumoniae TaxID=573 RepID=UPI003D355A85